MTYLELLRAVVLLPPEERTRFVSEAKEIVDAMDLLGRGVVDLPEGTHPKWAAVWGSLDEETVKPYEEAMRLTSFVSKG